jgi:ribosomal protein L19E
MNDNDKVSFAQAVKHLRENLPATIEYATIQAKTYRAKYLACVKEGFTEVQALELCWRS